MTPSDSSDDDVAANGRGADIAAFFHRGGKAHLYSGFSLFLMCILVETITKVTLSKTLKPTAP
jgi:hypothetical protein